jgi:hypothetical protein
MPHLDFERHDEDGRPADQVHADGTGARDDADPLHSALARLQNRRAQNELPPDSGASLTPWTELLGACHDAGELAVPVDQISNSENGVLPRLHTFLVRAAQRARQIPGALAVAELLDAQAQVLDLLGARIQDAAELLTDQAHAEQRTDPRSRAANSTSPAAGPAPEHVGAANSHPGRPAVAHPPPEVISRDSPAPGGALFRRRTHSAVSAFPRDRPLPQPTGRWTNLGPVRAWLEPSAYSDALAARDRALAEHERALLYRYLSGPRL